MAGLAAMFFASACGQDGGDLAPSAAAPVTAKAGTAGLAPASSFRPLSPGRAPSASACTRPAEYWVGHPASWWHRELQMGLTFYSKEEQLEILQREPMDNGRMNGLVVMGQQLIAARLNIAAGVPTTGLENIFSQADSLIGSEVIPPRGDGWKAAEETATVVEVLTAFNQGLVGPGLCP